MRIVVTSLCLALSTVVHADSDNRNLLPVGERAAFLANTGITSASAGAVFYNPANLSRMAHPTISISGTSFMRFSIYTEEFLGGEPLRATGFVVVPGALVSTHDAWGWRVATAVLVPYAFEFDHKSALTTTMPPGRATLLLRRKEEDLWVGGSASKTVGHWSFGLSLFGVRRADSSLTFLQSTSMEMGMEQGFQLILDQTSTLYGVTAVVGATYATEQFAVGARVQTPFWQLAGAGEIYLSSVTSNPEDGGSVVGEVERDDVDIKDPMPVDMGVGARVFLGPVALSADVNLQAGQTVTTVDDPDVGRSQKNFDPALRFSTGVEWQVTDGFALLGGAFYNRSAVGALREAGDNREDYVGGTLGLAWESGRTRTGVGAYAARSFGEVLSADPGASSLKDAHTTLFGAILTASYTL